MDISITSDNIAEKNDEIIVMLDKVIITINGSALHLTDEESSRLILIPKLATVTILDDDGKYQSMLRLYTVTVKPTIILEGGSLSGIMDVKLDNLDNDEH